MVSNRLWKELCLNDRKEGIGCFLGKHSGENPAVESWVGTLLGGEFFANSCAALEGERCREKSVWGMEKPAGVNESLSRRVCARCR